MKEILVRARLVGIDEALEKAKELKELLDDLKLLIDPEISLAEIKEKSEEIEDGTP